MNVTRLRAVTGRRAMRVNIIPDQMALMHLPWMVITGYEIAGNAAVSVTFLTSPGYPYLIVLICIIKMIVLKWVFVKVIRRHMIFCIEQREK